MGLRITVLGGTSIRSEATGHELSPTGQALVLFTMLALNHPAPLQAERFADASGQSDALNLSWLDTPVHRLNNLLRQLPDLGGTSPVSRQGGLIRLHLPNDAVVDVTEFRALVERGRDNSYAPESYEQACQELARALNMLPKDGAPLLPGLAASEVQPYEQAQLREEKRIAERDWFKVCLALERFTAVAALLQRRFDEDPTDPQLCSWLARLQLSSGGGDREALNVINWHRSALREFGINDVSASVDEIEQAILGRRPQRVRSDPFRLELSFRSIPWLDVAEDVTTDGVEGHWFQITFDPGDVFLDADPWSVEWVTATCGGDRCRGSWWRIWPKHFDREWTFDAGLDNVFLRGDYAQARGNGGSGQFSLSRLSDSSFIGAYWLSYPVDDRGEMTKVLWDFVPMVWVRAHAARSVRLSNRLEHVDLSKLRLPDVQRALLAEFVVDARTLRHGNDANPSDRGCD